MSRASVLAPVLAALLALGTGSCGGGASHAGVDRPAGSEHGAAARAALDSPDPVAVPASHIRGDEDDDDVGAHIVSGRPLDKDLDQDHDRVTEAGAGGYVDADDKAVRDFGHPANVADRRAVTELVDSYYAAAAAGDSTKVCALSFKRLADKIIPEDEGSKDGPYFSHGLKTCVAIMTVFAKHLHKVLAAGVKVMDVRVKGREAKVMLGSRFTPAAVTSAKREGSVWKMGQVFSVPMP